MRLHLGWQDEIEISCSVFGPLITGAWLYLGADWNDGWYLTCCVLEGPETNYRHDLMTEENEHALMMISLRGTRPMQSGIA